MKFLDLFSGIGGFSLGLERAGTTVPFAKLTPFAGASSDTGHMSPATETSEPLLPLDLPQTASSKLWATPMPSDVDGGRTTKGKLRQNETGIRRQASTQSLADFHAKTFPSPERARALKASAAGYGRNTGELLGRFDRIAIVENVTALLGRGFQQFSETLPRSGMTRMALHSAAAVGAPHRRDRVWIVAYPQQQGEGRRGIPGPGESLETVGGGASGQPLRTGAAVFGTQPAAIGRTAPRKPA